MRQAVSATVLLLALLPAFAGPGDAVLAAATDLERQPDTFHRHVRYLWHPGPKESLDEFDRVLRFQVNSLSRAGALYPPARVTPDLWRVDFRHYRWRAEVWEKLRDIDPYFRVRLAVVKGKRVKLAVKEVANPAEEEQKQVNAAAPWLPGEAMAYLANATGSQAPIVRADWFFVQTARQLSLANKQTGAGYYDFLGVKNRDDFFGLAKFKLEDSRALKLDQLAAVAKSGVSHQNRQVDRERALTGSLWFTLDVNDESGRGNAVRNLRREDYRHQAEEHYLSLPNGLPAYFLGDNNGNRQDSAPDFIGGDTSPLNQSRDLRIHVCVACIRCHAGNVLQPLNDWARANYTVGRLALLVPANFKDLDKDAQFQLFLKLKRQYLTDINVNLEADREAYRRKFVEACGLDADPLSKAYAKHYHAYADAPVTQTQAALELGVTREDMIDRFQKFAVAKGAVDPQLGALFFPVPPETMSRLHWEELYPLAQKMLAGDLGK